jgi:peptidoglycan-associated lipoprotein
MPYGTKHASLWIVAVTFAAFGVVFTTGCGKKPTPTTDVVKTPVTQTQTPVEQPKEPAAPAVEPQTEMVLQDVYFDYDKANLREDARLTLEQDAQMLSRNTGSRVLLEGHCDERGTVEYNLALGDRRAQSVKSYLVQFGVDAGRLSTISYGEERPFAPGTDEAAWSQNRRVHFVIQK